MALAETALHEVAHGHYEADLPEAWVALQGVHGGFAASLAVRAVTRTLADPARSPRAATFGLVRGLRPGPATFTVEEVRTGRSLATYHVAAAQGDGPPSMVGRLHLSPPWEGAEFSDLTPPPPARPADAPRLLTPDGRGHLHHLTTWTHPATTMFAGAAQARWLAWTRPTEPDRVDPEWLTMLGDYFPPTVMVRSTGPRRAVTIEYGIQFHTGDHPYPLAPGDLLTCELHAPHASGGFAVEDGSIWAPDGTLLATMRQTRLAG